ncbi:indolethylamine N-methyltransferase-like [Lingula anatina]|uniref:Indolethylamine N-methyltransferase-like n=1 Tax=Lingula anatina TaxID=7574 RepID=A0A1S3HSZ4_LINAN|nr:indolethylamine N-methyltransferase-like [Lingula anatina]|eukprot:XP_013389162.1 indolethylamine N-methyltransferase-like [Lingula anatina]
MNVQAATAEAVSGDRYHDLFDTELFLKNYYVEERPSATFARNTLAHVLRSGRIGGARLLDLGSGPTIAHHVILSKYFNELAFSDLTEKNREAMRKWRDGEAGAFDWDSTFKCVAALEGEEENWMALKESFRNKMSTMYPCDVINPNPLHPVLSKPFDCVTNIFCLEAASHFRVIRNVTSLLKDGGHLIIVNSLRQSAYIVGDVHFSARSLEKEEYIRSLKFAGLDEISWYEGEETTGGHLTNSSGVYMIVAMKKAI